MVIFHQVRVSCCPWDLRILKGEYRMRLVLPVIRWQIRLQLNTMLAMPLKRIKAKQEQWNRAILKTIIVSVCCAIFRMTCYLWWMFLKTISGISHSIITKMSIRSMDAWHKHGTVLVRSDDEKFGVESFEEKLLFHIIIIIRLSIGNHTTVFLV